MSISGDGAVDQMEKGGAVTGQDPIKVREIILTLKKSVNISVIAKLTPNITDISIIAKAVQEAGGDGVCLAGGQSSLLPVDIYNDGQPKYRKLHGASHGSLGGPSIKLMAFSQVALVSKKISLPIVGGGGLCNAEDALMMMWGATMVTFCTFIMWYGWDVVRKTVKGMEKYLKEKNLTYEQIIGKSLQYLC